MANNINTVDSGSSIGNPIFNSTPKRSSFIERHNRAAGLFSQGVVSEKKNVSLGGRTGTVQLNILTDTSNDDIREIERLTQKLETGHQKLQAVERLNAALINKQSELKNKVTPLNKEVRDLESQARNITRKYNVLLKKYENDVDMFGMNEPDQAEEYLGMIKKLSPAMDELCDLCDKQRDTILELHARLEEVTEEKQSFTWKNAIEKEQEILARSEKYINTLNNAYDKSSARLEKQSETLNELREELEEVDAENEKMEAAANIKKMQQVCADLEAKVQSLMQSNEALKRQNSELVSRPSVSPAGTSAATSAGASGETPQLKFFKQKCLDLQRELNDANATLLDTDQTLMSPAVHSSTLGGLSNQVDDVKQEVRSMKQALEQSKKALRELLPLTQGGSLNKSAAESTLNASRRLRMRQRLNKTA